MANTGCASGHCNCAGDFGDAPCKSAASCFDEALAKCKATKNCKSFALGAGHRGGCVQQRPRALSPRADLRPLLLNSYELYALTNWSAVPNGDWNA